jgi:hypothetical protein
MYADAIHDIMVLTWSLTSTTRQNTWEGRSKAASGKSGTCSMCPCGKYTTTLFFFGSEISGPAHACHSSRHTEEAEAEAVGAGAEHQDEAEESDDGVSSSSVVLRSIRPMKSNQKPVKSGTIMRKAKAEEG